MLWVVAILFTDAVLYKATRSERGAVCAAHRKRSLCDPVGIVIAPCDASFICAAKRRGSERPAGVACEALLSRQNATRSEGGAKDPKHAFGSPVKSEALGPTVETSSFAKLGEVSEFPGKRKREMPKTAQAPITWRVPLPHVPVSASIARTLVRAALMRSTANLTQTHLSIVDASAAVDRDVAELLTSELVTNAVEHTTARAPSSYLWNYSIRDSVSKFGTMMQALWKS